MKDNAYYFNLLNKDEADAYQQLYLSLSRHQSKCEISLLNPHKIRNVFQSVINDHPELYYVSPRFTTAIKTLGIKQIGVISCEENYRLERSRIDNEIKNTVQKLTQLATGKSELEQYIVILDYLVENVQYEINNLLNQNAASAIYFHKSQCSGISAAFKLLCDALNLYCINTPSSARQNGVMSPHQWNIVKIGNNYYHVDATYVIGHNEKGKTPYSYMEAFYSDETFQNDHVLQKQWPKCVDDSLERLTTRNGNKLDLLKEINSFYELRNYLTEEIKMNNREIYFYSKIEMPQTQFEKMLTNSIQTVANALQVRLNSASYSMEGMKFKISLDY